MLKSTWDGSRTKASKRTSKFKRVSIRVAEKDRFYPGGVTQFWILVDGIKIYHAVTIAKKDVNYSGYLLMQTSLKDNLSLGKYQRFWVMQLTDDPIGFASCMQGVKRWVIDSLEEDLKLDPHLYSSKTTVPKDVVIYTTEIYKTHGRRGITFMGRDRRLGGLENGVFIPTPRVRNILSLQGELVQYQLMSDAWRLPLRM